jgi:high-affinity iron transporter
LQEAGWITQAGVPGPRIEWLGVYPSWESLLAQLGVATLAIIGFLTNTRSLKASAASSSR